MEGESGSGKGLVARQIHEVSHRRGRGSLRDSDLSPKPRRGRDEYADIVGATLPAKVSRLRGELACEPCAGQLPVAHHGLIRNAQHRRGLRDGKTSEEAQFYDPHLTRLELPQRLQRSVERTQLGGLISTLPPSRWPEVREATLRVLGFDGLVGRS